MDSFAWLLAGVVGGLGNALFFQWRLQQAVEARTLVRAEAQGFVRGFALWITVPCVAMWLLQMSVAGPAGLNYMAWPWPQKGLAIGIQGFVLVALAHWVFIRDGADVVARVLAAARRPVFTSPGSIKAVVALTLLANLAGAVAYVLKTA
jgi:hypothetical protein